jgi:hypothetical protein
MQTESRLLSLPGELRNQIYTYVFSSHDHVPHKLPIPSPISHGYTTKDYVPGSVEHILASLRRKSNLSLLLTCRQIQREARLLAFAQTTFLTTLRTSTSILASLGAACLTAADLSAITSLTILTPRPQLSSMLSPSDPAYGMHIQCGCLDHLAIALRLASPGDPMASRMANLRHVTILYSETSFAHWREYVKWPEAQMERWLKAPGGGDVRVERSIAGDWEGESLGTGWWYVEEVGFGLEWEETDAVHNRVDVNVRRLL